MQTDGWSGLRLSFSLYKWVVVPGHTESPIAVWGSRLILGLHGASSTLASWRPRGWAGSFYAACPVSLMHPGCS